MKTLVLGYGYDKQSYREAEKMYERFKSMHYAVITNEPVCEDFERWEAYEDMHYRLLGDVDPIVQAIVDAKRAEPEGWEEFVTKEAKWIDTMKALEKERQEIESEKPVQKVDGAIGDFIEFYKDLCSRHPDAARAAPKCPTEFETVLEVADFKMKVVSRRRIVFNFPQFHKEVREYELKSEKAEVVDISKEFAEYRNNLVRTVPGLSDIFTHALVHTAERPIIFELATKGFLENRRFKGLFPDEHLKAKEFVANLKRPRMHSPPGLDTSVYDAKIKDLTKRRKDLKPVLGNEAILYKKKKDSECMDLFIAQRNKYMKKKKHLERIRDPNNHDLMSMVGFVYPEHSYEEKKPVASDRQIASAVNNFLTRSVGKVKYFSTVEFVLRLKDIFENKVELSLLTPDFLMDQINEYTKEVNERSLIFVNKKQITLGNAITAVRNKMLISCRKPSYCTQVALLSNSEVLRIITNRITKGYLTKKDLNVSRSVRYNLSRSVFI
jgi:hypothetical protein